MFLGFTLAEVLITLGIIGIVAAMTIPTLINNAQDAQFKSAWKKEYSVISQAIQKMTTDNGGSLNGIIDSWDRLYDPLTSGSYLNVAQKYKYSGDNGGWSNYNPATGIVDTTYIKEFNGNNCWEWWWCTNNGGRAILQDGSFFWVLSNASTAGAQINIDVNGYKGPNTVGKDIFGLTVTIDGKVTPLGVGTSPSDTNYQYYGCDKTLAGTDGAWCSAYYLYK